MLPYPLTLKYPGCRPGNPKRGAVFFYLHGRLSIAKSANWVAIAAVGSSLVTDKPLLKIKNNLPFLFCYR